MCAAAVIDLKWSRQLKRFLIKVTSTHNLHASPQESRTENMNDPFLNFTDMWTKESETEETCTERNVTITCG